MAHPNSATTAALPVTRLTRPARIYHSVTSHAMELIDDNHATGDAYVSVIGAEGLLEWGRYRDRYVRTTDGWRFEFRRAYRDSLGRP